MKNQTGFLNCADYLSEALFTHYLALKKELHATSDPSARALLLPEIGLTVVLSDEATAMSEALEVLQDVAISDEKKPGERRKSLRYWLGKHKEDLVLSPNMAAYLTALPEREYQRGLKGCQPKAGSRATIRAEHYKQMAVSTQGLLRLNHVVAQLWQAAKDENKPLRFPRAISDCGAPLMYSEK